MRVIINNEWDNFTTSFYLEDYRNGKRIIIGQEDGHLVEHILGEAEAPRPISPLMKMPEHLAQEFIKGIVDYASGKEIKTVNENLLQGKLSATEKHLEDMRTGFTKMLDKLIQS